MPSTTHFIGTYKGRTASTHRTQRAAADDFFNKYPDAKRVVIAACIEGPNGSVLYPFGGSRVEVTRKQVATLDGAPLWPTAKE